jgi:CheY-like chemotaxis protein
LAEVRKRYPEIAIGLLCADPALAIVHRVSLGMHWPLTLHSQPGKGSIFKISVPGSEPLQLAGPDKPSTPLDSLELPRLAVLSVDDDQLVRNATLRLLTSWNVSVQACSTGDEALALMKTRDRSRRWKVLLDYRLANSDNGLVLAKRIKGACGGDLTIFLMTAETNEQILAQARSQGLRVLRKPLKTHQPACSFDVTRSVGSAVAAN